MVCAPSLAQRSGIAAAGQTLIFQRLGAVSAALSNLQIKNAYIPREPLFKGGMS
jgi:hypothetical protein